MSTIDRQKLEKGLIADRANAKYSDDEMRQGRSVPPLPGEPPPTPPEAAAAAAPPSDKAPAAPAAQTRHSPPVRGSAQAPQELSLTTPSVHALPQGEAPHAPPSAPLGVGAKAAQKPAPSAPAPAPPQQQLAMAPSPVPRDARAAPPAVMSGKGAAVTLTAAEIGFTADGSLSGDDRKRLADVAAMVKQGGGKVRIIGYGRQGRGADAVQQELESFNAALDRANAAAQALAKLGVSANQITVQVEPELVNGGLQAGRAEVLLDY